MSLAHSLKEALYRSEEGIGLAVSLSLEYDAFEERHILRLQALKVQHVSPLCL